MLEEASGEFGPRAGNKWRDPTSMPKIGETMPRYLPHLPKPLLQLTTCWLPLLYFLGWPQDGIHGTTLIVTNAPMSCHQQHSLMWWIVFTGGKGSIWECQESNVFEGNWLDSQWCFCMSFCFLQGPVAITQCLYTCFIYWSALAKTKAGFPNQACCL